MALAALLCIPGMAGAQELVRPAQPWKTLQTRWFDVHFPSEAEAWVTDLAPRLDAIHDAVAALVGYAPPGRTTVVIDDPFNQPNGSAIPVLGMPVINLWPTPPGPTDVIANHRGWGIKLVSHEFGHIAHLSRPARRTQWLWHLLPASAGPIVAATPRWAFEGYATWIEGKVTGTGRPHGVWRAALLRELALGGRLPGYGAMSAGGGYKGGGLAYLAGSAYWEWLAERRGDTSMTLVFRRQTARIARGFDEAFRGVYGEAPAAMYARFSAELTARAFAVDSAVTHAGLVTGTRLARFGGAVGAPALTRDGRRLALALPGTSGPPRIIVTRPDTQVTTAQQRAAAARALARDPQDVPALRVVPSLADPIATLRPRRGHTFSQPRFIDSAGTRVLLRTTNVRRDGSQRPGLVIWDVVSGRIRALTRDFAAQDADPSPDGSQAAAVHCAGGVCDIVMVSLRDGRTRTLLAGTPTRVFSHPRWSRDGSRLVISVQEGDGQWQLALVSPPSSSYEIVTPADDVNRHSAQFDATGESLIYISEAGGIPNVESMRLSDRAITPRTRVVGSAYEPAPMPDGGLLYLLEYSGGMELYRLDARTQVSGPAPDVSITALRPALPPRRESGTSLAVQPVGAPVRYGAGPRRHRWMAQGSMARDGLQNALMVVNTDPANRLAWSLSALHGTASAWRGGAATLAWYGTRPNLRTEAFWLEQRATRQWDAPRTAAFDLRVAGASAAVELPIAGLPTSQRLQLSTFLGAAQERSQDTHTRLAVTGSYALATSLGWRRSAGLSLRATGGRLADSNYARGSAGVSITAYSTRLDVRAHRASNGTPRSEQFSAGGFAPPLTDDATFANRIAVPALPVGIALGTSLYEVRIARPMVLLPVTAYAHSVGTDWRPERHSVVAGIEEGFAIDNLGAIGFPRLRVLGGAAVIVRGPLRQHATAYLSLAWRP